MAEIKQTEKAKLIIGIFYKKGTQISTLINKLKERFGDIEIESQEFDFNFTNYYELEMGENLVKKFLIFREIIERSKLSEIKILTNILEQKLSSNNKRTINIDPGYLTKSQLVLASAKESAYKIYLDKGIFAHLTYVFINKSYQPTERCFPDFKSKEIIDFFNQIRLL